MNPSPITSVTKTIGFSVPPAIAHEMEEIANQESRTKSELFREMLRVYLRYRKQRDIDEEQWVMGLICEAKEEQEKNPQSEEDLIKESERLAQYGAEQAKKMGLERKSIDKIIHEARKRR